MSQTVANNVLNPSGGFPLVLTCEHASREIPPEYNNLGISEGEIQRHIGWDIGAYAVTSEITELLDCTSIYSLYSRLLIDCNRALEDHDLIVPRSDGTYIPGNSQLKNSDITKRIKSIYEPFHSAVDDTLTNREDAPNCVISIHSFTPVLAGKERPFDLGILFDTHEDLAKELGEKLSRKNLRIRYNEPYSGKNGLIFSARRHGKKYSLAYLEIEINNGILLHMSGIKITAAKIAAVLKEMFAGRGD